MKRLFTIAFFSLITSGFLSAQSDRFDGLKRSMGNLYRLSDAKHAAFPKLPAKNNLEVN
jgi:hypothetical protein